MNDITKKTIGELYRSYERMCKVYGFSEASKAATLAHDAYVALSDEANKALVELQERHIKRFNDATEALRQEKMEDAGAALVEQRRLNAVLEEQSKNKKLTADLERAQRQVDRLCSYLGTDKDDEARCAEGEALAEGRFERLRNLVVTAGCTVIEGRDGSLKVSNKGQLMSEMDTEALRLNNRDLVKERDEARENFARLTRMVAEAGNEVKRDANGFIEVKNTHGALYQAHNELQERYRLLSLSLEECQADLDEHRKSRKSQGEAIASKEEAIAREKDLRKRHALAHQILRNEMQAVLAKAQRMMNSGATE